MEGPRTLPVGLHGRFPFFYSSRFSGHGQDGLPALIKKMEPSIVVIVTYGRNGSMLGQGSGFFVDQEGDVVTNFHVLQGASRAVVKTADGKEHAVQNVLAEDKEGDLVRVSVEISKEAVRPLPVSAELPEVGRESLLSGRPSDSIKRSRMALSLRFGMYLPLEKSFR